MASPHPAPSQPPAGSGPARWLTVLAWVEGLSLLGLLLVTMPLKYFADVPGPNRVLGMAHGILTVAYVSVLLYVWSARRWPGRALAWGLAASFIPVLPFWVERRVFAPLLRRDGGASPLTDEVGEGRR